MNRKFLALVALAATAPVWGADTPATKPAAAAPAPTPEQVVAQFRNDLQAARADIMAKGLTLTADQAAKFWPLYDQFQKEQNAVIDGQIKAIQKYADSYATLTDADSLAFVKAQLERDQQMHDLRVKWLGKFQTVVPAGTAARAIQIDRRLSQVAQVELSSRIPLVR
jgi:Spy/CpxP family protein refolding chaperone